MHYKYITLASTKCKNIQLDDFQNRFHPLRNEYSLYYTLRLLLDENYFILYAHHILSADLQTNH